jgi:2TM domain
VFAYEHGVVTPAAGDSLWFYWPMMGTGIAVAITGVALLGIGGLLGPEWEQREIDKDLRRRVNRPGG